MKYSYKPLDGSGSLTISWSSEPKGDAVEARKGSGVGFFSDKKTLLCVIFDEVKVNHDHQVLEFPLHCIEITIKHGQVEYTVTHRKATPHLRKRNSRRRQSI